MTDAGTSARKGPHRSPPERAAEAGDGKGDAARAERKARGGPPRAPEETERKVIYDPAAAAEGDRATLSEEEAFEDVHPYATAETYEAAVRRDPAAFPGSALRETGPGDEPIEGPHEPPRDATPMGPRRKEE